MEEFLCPRWQSQIQVFLGKYHLSSARYNKKKKKKKKKKKREVSHMDWMPIQITEISSYLFKAHN